MSRKLFTDEELNRLRNLFREFDVDGSGAISFEEAKNAVKKFGLNLTSAQVSEIITKVDTNKSGAIEFVEFMKFATFARERMNVKNEEPVVKSRGFAPSSSAAQEEPAVKSRSFAPSPSSSAAQEEPAVKSRNFAPSPSSSAAQEVAVPVVLLPNDDAKGDVSQYGTLPLTLKNNLPLGPNCVPYNFIVNQDLSGGVFKILLISQLDAPAWGRWAGLVTSSNLGLKTYHIVGNNAIDHDLCQISVLGVKSNGNWRYRKPEYAEPAGRVELALEYQAAAGGKLRASWNGQTLPFGVKNIPQAVRFSFELPNSLELTIVSLVKVQTPTISTLPGHTDYDW